MIAPLPSEEAERQKALDRYDVLDTDPEQAFDDITLLASQICGTEIATITLIDRNRQWFKSKVGITMSETDAFSISGLAYPAEFRIHVERNGWHNWTPGVEGSYDSGVRKRLEAIQFRFPQGMPAGTDGVSV